MAETDSVIVNSTPLIILGNTRRVELLRDLFGEVLVPDAVWREVTAKHDDASRWLQGFPEWVHVVHSPALVDRSLLPAKLHAGEIEVILLAMQNESSVVVLDDNAARRTASYLGLTVTGTLGILLLAKQEGLINKVGPCVDEMRRYGFRVSDVVVRRVLSEAQEL